MANKLTQIQPKSRYLEAANSLTPLTMLTAAEAKSLSTAGQELIGTNEELIYKYRDEFLHLQRAAEQGITSLDMLVEDPAELNILATAWGFTCTVQDKFQAKIVYRKNLGQEEIERKLSNINIDWTRPKTPTVDVAYYRQSGNLVPLADSTIVLPDLEATRLFDIKKSLGITDNSRYYNDSQRNFTNDGRGVGAVLSVNLLNGNPYGFSGVIKGGQGYSVADVIRFPVTAFGGNSGLGTEIRILVSAVDRYGSIIGATVSGTAGITRGYTVIDLTTGQIT